MPTPAESHAPDLHPIRQLRDEVRLQLHLANAEIQEEWQRVEVKWNRLEGEFERLKDRAARPTRAIGHGFDTLAHEVAEGYRRVGAALRRPV